MCRAGSPKAWRYTKRRRSRRIGAIVSTTPSIQAIKEKKLLPIAELDRGFIHPSYPEQVIVSYYQGGRTITYIAEKWGYDKVLT